MLIQLTYFIYYLTYDVGNTYNNILNHFIYRTNQLLTALLAATVSINISQSAQTKANQILQLGGARRLVSKQNIHFLD